tara:strand:- start:76 stop:363 length:288 start_codon:yes stop_codon:yes gene_type:complete
MLDKTNPKFAIPRIMIRVVRKIAGGFPARGTVSPNPTVLMVIMVIKKLSRNETGLSDTSGYPKVPNKMVTIRMLMGIRMRLMLDIIACLLWECRG